MSGFSCHCALYDITFTLNAKNYNKPNAENKTISVFRYYAINAITEKSFYYLFESGITSQVRGRKYLWCHVAFKSFQGFDSVVFSFPFTNL